MTSRQAIDNKVGGELILKLSWVYYVKNSKESNFTNTRY
jgi:hypothetical protein